MAENTLETTELSALLIWHQDAHAKNERLKKLVGIAWEHFYTANNKTPRSISAFLNSKPIIRDILICKLINKGSYYYSTNLAYSSTPYIDPDSIKNTDEIEAEIKQETQGNSSYIEITIKLKQHPNLH